MLQGRDELREEGNGEPSRRRPYRRDRAWRYKPEHGGASLPIVGRSFGRRRAECGGASCLDLAAAAASRSRDQEIEGFLPGHSRRGSFSQGKDVEGAGAPRYRGPPNGRVDHPGLTRFMGSQPGEQAGIPGGNCETK